jgi:hypothetical protein
MNKKLLLSTALVGGMISGSSAIAQTTVSGSLDLHYRMQGFSTAGGFNSNEGVGRETQLNIASKGKLNNGWDYLAGFSLEFDGNARNPVAGTQKADAYRTLTGTQASYTIAGVSSSVLTQTISAVSVSVTPSSDATEANSISNENIYIDFINASSGTTITVGVDHIQNITGTVVPQVMGNSIDNVAVGMGAKATNTMGANPKESIGFGVVQAIPGAGLNASAWFAPNNGDFGNTDQGTLANAQVAGTRNSAYELGLTGSDTFGVKGLSLRYFYNKEKVATGQGADIIGKSYGIAYQTGAFGVGAEKHTQNRNSSSSTTDADLTTNTYGVTYAASQNVTLGLVQMRNDTVGSVKEKITSLQLGYNLGPVAVIAAYSKGDDVGGTSGNDIKEGAIRLSTKF